MTRRGRIPEIDINNLDCWGKCDRTGRAVMYKDLKPQMEYAGTALYWTGMMVAEEYLDEPNPQLCTPPIKADPIPIENPRYWHLIQGPNVPTWNGEPSATSSTITLSWNPVQASGLAGAATNYAVQWYIEGSTIIESTLKDFTSPTQMTEPTYTITNLFPNTTYVVSVAAINNVVFASTTSIPPIAPNIPGGTLSYNISSFSQGSYPNPAPLGAEGYGETIKITPKYITTKGA